MQFEVFIPSPEPDGFDVTLRVDAANWMQALKLGLRRTYSEENPVRNVFCDIKDNDLIHVTDLVSRRVFKIWRVSEGELVGDSVPEAAAGPDVQEGIPTEPDATAGAPGRFRHPKEYPAVAVTPKAPDIEAESVSQSRIPTIEVPSLKSGHPLGIRSETGAFRKIGARDIEGAAPNGPGGPRIVLESVTPTSERMRALEIGRDIQVEEATVADSALEDVFLEMAELFDGEQTIEAAVRLSLDLAMRHIEAESGSVLFSNPEGTHLYFAAARGPKSRELMERDFQIPMDQGIVGFCVREGVSLAISEASHDPRFYAEISEELGYATRAILCAPIQADGRSFGAVELVNHRHREAFTSAEMNILTYVGNQAGQFIRSLLA